MKKILHFFILLTVNTTFITPVIACNGYDFNGGGGDKPLPPPPVPKDLKFYQDLMQNSLNIINDFVNNIKELEKYKNDKDIFPTPEDYKRTIKELQAEQASYQATVFDCQYQILYLQTSGVFNPVEKIQAIDYLQQEIKQLNLSLSIKKQYISDYDKQEIDELITLITAAQKILNGLKLKNFSY